MVVDGPLRGMLCTPPVAKSPNAIVFRPFNFQNLSQEKLRGCALNAEDMRAVAEGTFFSSFPGFSWVDPLDGSSAPTGYFTDGMLVTFSDRLHHFSFVGRSLYRMMNYIFYLIRLLAVG